MARDWEAAFEKLAAAIHRQHVIASGALSWRECDQPLCFLRGAALTTATNLQIHWRASLADTDFAKITDTNTAAAVLAFCDGKLIESELLDDGRTVAFMIEYDPAKYETVRAEWDRKSLVGNIWKFVSRRQELVRAARAKAPTDGRR